MQDDINLQSHPGSSKPNEAQGERTLGIKHIMLLGLVERECVARVFGIRQEQSLII